MVESFLTSTKRGTSSRKHPITKKEKDIIYKSYDYLGKKWPKKIVTKALQFPENRPFFNRIITDEKGKIYVAKLEPVSQEEKKNVIFDVFNEDGYYIYQISIPFIPDLIRNGHLYYIDESDDGIKIKRFRIKNWLQIKNN